jgi:4'-phosphopantetheinyl transferase
LAITGKLNGDVAHCGLTRIAAVDARIELWFANLADDSARAAYCARVLSADERARAARFRADQDRHRFTIARGLLRALLGTYLDEAPEDIPISVTAKGKPFVAGARIRFNISHSEERALYAFSRDCEVGADLECLGRKADWESLAARLLSSRERTELERMPAAARGRGYFTCWVRKEAVIKATGAGLSLPLSSVETLGAPVAETGMIRIPLNGRTCELFDVNVGADYAAAVAILPARGNGSAC